MIFVEEILKNLKKKKIFFYTGVPDSILKKNSNYLQNLDKSKHIITKKFDQSRKEIYGVRCA